ncbi:hypothetical protein [Achromobacter sp. Root565]|uniref:hypothetical protein n=1 Tax=Achromobacter sp. Root565 TaxID=1736564 RepID=UPI0006F8724C|nr:hypothetical protein [Achromobacter sp. Root565]KRA01267.1 hypothetical protein ASD71_04030 [Achromobacter sp. Root565]
MSAGSALAEECRLQLSNPEVDYGALYRGELLSGRSGSTLPLGKRELMLIATCNSPTPFTFRFTGEAATSKSYRFANRGEFTVRMTGATVDGQKMDLALTEGHGAPLQAPANTKFVVPGASVSAWGHGKPATGRVFTAKVEIDTQIDEQMTRVRDVTLLTGHGALELHPSK